VQPIIGDVSLAPRGRAACYIVFLVALNGYFAGHLFRAEFTDNMLNVAGTFMGISRFILRHWPHLGWFPWWFNGEPFENSYTPALNFIDAAFAWITATSPARAYNFITGAFYVLGPVFLFLFAWRVSGWLETSFFAALLYSLFSPAVMFSAFRSDVGLWNPWRLRVMAYYGEGPHSVVLSTLPAALLLVYLALTTRNYVWLATAVAAMAFVTLVNPFGAVDLAIGCLCLVAAFPQVDMPKKGLLTIGMGIAAYLLASAYLTPTFLRTMAEDAQRAGGDYKGGSMLAAQALILPGFVFLWFAVQRVEDYFTRFSLLLAFWFFEIVALNAIGNIAALPQPHRYSLELELAICLAAVFTLRGVVIRFPIPLKAAVLVLVALAVVHQTLHYRRYARGVTASIDITKTIEYQTAQWLGANLGDLRAFVSSGAGLWLNAFVDTPQMNSGHTQFNPNFAVEEGATYAIYSGENAGARDAEVSILWLKAFGCHAIYVPGPNSRIATKPFVHPGKFQGVLPVLWHAEDDTIYAVPQRTKSLGHVVPEAAIVQRQPIHGLDTDEVARYVAALDDPALPGDVMTWPDPNRGHIDTILHPGQVLSIQSTYDKGWIATANGKPADVTRDGIGLTVVHPACDGPCSIEFVFDGGGERKVFRAVSWIMILCGLAGGLMRRRAAARYP
jgi:hypothetical protein